METKSHDAITVTRTLEIIGGMADSADIEAGNDPDDDDKAERAEALNLAWHALQDVLDQQGGEG